MCRTLDVSRSGYYYFISRKPSHYALRRAAILREIIALHEAYPTLGLRPLHALVCEKIPCSKNTVHSLMQHHHIHSIRKRSFHCTTNSNHSLSISPNLLQQNFLADSPNSIWVGDITYIPTDEGWLYAAIVKDLFTRQVVGYACSSFIDAALVSAAFLMAVRRHKPSPGLIFHSDRGSQYCSHSYRELLSSHNIVSSMSRKGNPYDNAVAESFFSCFKCEMVHLHHFETHTSAKSMIFWYIEAFYNNIRPNSALGYLSPNDYVFLNATVNENNHCGFIYRFVI